MLISCHLQHCRSASGHESESCKQLYSKYLIFTFTTTTTTTAAAAAAFRRYSRLGRFPGGKLSGTESLLVPVCVPISDTSSLFLAVDSASTTVGLFRLLARRSGTRYQTNSEIRRVVLIVLGSFLRQSLRQAFTSVTSALEVLLNSMRYINPRFTYLLTYLLIDAVGYHRPDSLPIVKALQDETFKIRNYYVLFTYSEISKETRAYIKING